LRVRTLRGMVNELLNLTAIETGNFTLRRAPVDVAAVAAEVVEAQRERSAERKITLSLCGECPGRAPGPQEAARQQTGVLADKDALSIVCTNLVENEIKYGREGGHVHVTIGREGMYATVSVKDDGIGMAPADCAKVFDEFYRARNEQTASIPGTGLGLSLVKRLTELHQGTVEAASVLGEGSEFTVRIPLAQGSWEGRGGGVTRPLRVRRSSQLPWPNEE